MRRFGLHIARMELYMDPITLKKIWPDECAGVFAAVQFDEKLYALRNFYQNLANVTQHYVLRGPVTRWNCDIRSYFLTFYFIRVSKWPNL